MAFATGIAVKLLSGGMAGLIKQFEDEREILIGRDADVHVRLHPTEDKMVGRRHARLFYENHRWCIEAIHKHGLLIWGQPLTGTAEVRDGDIYQLGPNGPELRVSILDDSAPATISATIGGDERRSSRPMRRVEFNPEDMTASIKLESRRTVRRLTPILLVLAIGLIGVAFSLFVFRGKGNAVGGGDILRKYAGSVFRAAGTVQFKCSHPDVDQKEWARYLYTHGSSFVVGAKDEWIYALTNDHVFGDAARPKVEKRTACERILTRWSEDWSKFHSTLFKYEVQLRALDHRDATEENRIRIDQGNYVDSVIRQCECAEDDPDWRQVVVNGIFTRVEIVDSAADADLVLFKFKLPEKPAVLEPLPLRMVTTEDQDRLSGQSVFILGYPGAGDSPLRRLSDALHVPPDNASGVVSGIKRDDRHGGFSIQTTAPINPGNSGGPLFDEFGNVIGINTEGPSKAEAEGVTFSLTLGRAVEMLRKQGIEPRTPATSFDSKHEH